MLNEEFTEKIVNLSVESKLLQVLKDNILDNTRLNYSKDGLKLDDPTKMMELFKALFPEEYAGRVTYLQNEVEKEEG